MKEEEGETEGGAEGRGGRVASLAGEYRREREHLPPLNLAT